MAGYPRSAVLRSAGGMRGRILVIAGHPPRAVTPEFDVKMVVARRPAGNARQLVFIGGSYTKLAIFPELLQTLLKEKNIDVYPKNLRHPRSCIDEHLLLLNEVVTHCTDKPVVFYDLREEAFLKDFQDDSKLNNVDAFRQSYIGKKYDSGAAPAQYLSRFAADNVCLIRDREYLRDQLFNAVGAIVDFDEEYEKHIRPYPTSKTELSEMGTSAGYGANTQSQMLEKVRSYSNPLGWNESYQKEWSLAWFNRIKEFCSANQLPLVLLWLPECNPTTDGRREQQLLQNYRRLADGKKVWFVDLHSIDKSPEHFRDPVHCNMAGEVTTTEHLARLLAEEPLRSIVHPATEAVE